MIKDTEKDMRPSRFWALTSLGAGAVGGWIVYAVAQLVKALH